MALHIYFFYIYKYLYHCFTTSLKVIIGNTSTTEYLMKLPCGHNKQLTLETTKNGCNTFNLTIIELDVWDVYKFSFRICPA